MHQVGIRGVVGSRANAQVGGTQPRELGMGAALFCDQAIRRVGDITCNAARFGIRTWVNDTAMCCNTKEVNALVVESNENGSQRDSRPFYGITLTEHIAAAAVGSRR